MIREDILSFLYFGYLVPKKVVIPNWIKERDKNSNLKSLSETQLMDKGISEFKKSLDNFDCNKINVVPLSGGLDSRAILAELLSRCDNPKKIHTITIGTPGTFDFDFGTYVAKKVGTRHHTIDLTKIKIEQSSLEEVVRMLHPSLSWLFDSFYNSLIYKKFGKKAVYWSGFMGDPLSGNHIPMIENDTWEKAKLFFLKHNRFVKSINLIPKYFNPEKILPQSPLFSKENLNYDDQLDFLIRQLLYIKKNIIPEGYNCHTPFLSQHWVNFILSVPRKYRVNQYLYKKILKKMYPKLFSLPTKNSLGLKLGASNWRLKLEKLFIKIRYFVFPKKVNPLLNYIDFNKALREKSSLKNLVHKNIKDLKDRGVVDWIDIEGIWKAHQNRKVNYWDALTLLVALEINLKIGDRRTLND